MPLRVDLEGDLDLDVAAVADAEAGELELAEQLAGVGAVVLALVDRIFTRSWPSRLVVKVLLFSMGMGVFLSMIFSV